MNTRLTSTVSARDVQALAELLVSAVNRGSAVSFLKPLSLNEAIAWWQRTLDTRSPRGAVFVARDAGQIVGTVTLHAAWAPNQSHRAEVAKLLVHPQWERRGIGASLMQTLEDHARAAGFLLLTLDAKANSPAERLYRRLGWTVAGVIPQFARDPDGPWHDAVMMYKPLGA